MSEKCQFRTHASQQTTCTNRRDLLEHLVGAGEQRRRDFEIARFDHRLMLGARSSVGSVHLRPRRAARRRLEPVLAHSARAITLAHPAPLINTTPHGATGMAVIATVDTTRSHAGAPVRDGLRLINA
jgi:hypothetical protein